MDLREVPVGTWYEYRGSRASPDVLRERFAVVARRSKELVVEQLVEIKRPKGETARLLIRFRVDLTSAKEPKVTERIMRVGHSPPEAAPDDPTLLAFVPLEAVHLVGSETIQLHRGKVPARLYRRPWGSGLIEVWVNEKVCPFAPVRIRETTREGTISEVDFVSTGNDATAELPVH